MDLISECSLNFGQIPPPLELQAKLSESPGAVQLEKMFTVTLKLTNNRYMKRGGGREGGREERWRKDEREREEEGEGGREGGRHNFSLFLF